jgi:hypothetical protein
MAKTLKYIKHLVQILVQPLVNPMAKTIKFNLHNENLFHKFKVTNHHRDADLNFHQDNNRDHSSMNLLHFLHCPHTIDIPNHVLHSLSHSLHWESKFLLQT